MEHLTHHTTSSAMIASITASMLPAQGTSADAASRKGSALTVDNVSLVAALSSLMATVYYLSTTLVG